MKSKKVLACLLALASITSAFTIVDTGMLQKVGYSSVVSAVESMYKYANADIYTHTFNYLSHKDADKNEVLTWTDNNGYVYKIVQLTVTHEAPDKSIVTDLTENYIATSGYTGSSLNIKPCAKVTIPDAVTKALEEDDITLKDKTQSLVVGTSAFEGMKLKSIDFTGAIYICDSALAKCSYITVEDIPETVNYMGTGVFAGSGLKTLSFKNSFTHIPDSMCANTKLSEVTFATPDEIVKIGKSAFANTVLTDYILGTSENAVIIDSSAFEGCTQIKSLVIPDNVVRIDSSVFKNCTSLKSVTFGENTLVTDKESFSGCTSLTEVKFNKVMQSIGGGAFKGCTSLVNVSDLPETLKDWVEVSSTTGYGFGNAVFANCTSIKSIKLPSSVTLVPDQLCVGCTSLTSFSFGGNISSIGLEAFSGCTNLQELSLTSGIKTIDDKAFTNCTSLKNPVVNECEELGTEVYKGCTSFTEVNINSKKYGTGVFKDCTNLKTATLNFNDIKELPEEIFSGCTKLESMGTSDLSSIEVIGVGAFKNCSSLTGLNCPSIVIIEASAFSNCTKLARVSDKDIAVQDYGAECFLNCKSLKQNVYSKASTIGESAFSGSGITSLNLEGTSGTTLVLGNNAFAGCLSLTEATIKIPSEMKYSIGSSLFKDDICLKSCNFMGTEVAPFMFSGCTKLDTLSLPKATTVSEGAFKGCTSLKAIDGVSVFDTISESAFYNCSSLENTYCDATTTFDGTSQYFGCSALKEASVSKTTDSMFEGCTALKRVTLADNISVICAKAFKNCSSLSSINLDNISQFKSESMMGTAVKSLKLTEVNSIDSSAFQNCINLVSADLEVGTIGMNAFTNCSNLGTLTIAGNNIGKKAFYGCNSLLDVNLIDVAGYSLVNIGSNAFADCMLLKELVVPESVTTIGAGAIGYCNYNKAENFIIVGYKDSEAESYANDNEVTFVDISTYDAEERIASRVKKGDLDLNGIVSVADAVKLQKWLVGVNMEGIYAPNMDVNGDGAYNVFDIIALKRVLLKSK